MYSPISHPYPVLKSLLKHGKPVTIYPPLAKLVRKFQFCTFLFELNNTEKIINNKNNPPARINFLKKKDDKLVFFLNGLSKSKSLFITF